jgi:hypothetical protein
VSTVSGEEDLMVELRSLFTRLDPVDPRLLEQARFAYCWRSVDAELAELSFDSLVDQDMAVAVRAGGDPAREPRMLGFGAVVDGEDVAIEVEVTGEEARTVLVGQLLPPEAATVELQTGTGDVDTVRTDELGRFMITPVPAGPVRLLVRLRERLVHTTWVSYARA